MAADTKIEWAHHTFNSWLGCTPVSEACKHCYAEGWAKRTGQSELWNGTRRRTTEAYWRQPLKWDRLAREAGERHRVFCCSLADVFDNQAEESWRADLWKLIAATPNLDWLLLTKRPQNIKKMLPADWGDGYPNVWLGTTVEDQTEANRRIPHLLKVPAKVRFLSCEPLLGPVWLLDADPLALGTATFIDGKIGHKGDGIHWVICGGESGPGARPMHPDWARELRDQCADAGVAFHFKQWGEWTPWKPLTKHQAEPIQRFGTEGRYERLAGTWVERVGKKAAGRQLDGVQHDGVPS